LRLAKRTLAGLSAFLFACDQRVDEVAFPLLIELLFGECNIDLRASIRCGRLACCTKCIACTPNDVSDSPAPGIGKNFVATLASLLQILIATG